MNQFPSPGIYGYPDNGKPKRRSAAGVSQLTNRYSRISPLYDGVGWTQTHSMESLRWSPSAFHASINQSMGTHNCAPVD
jgi:hypothetical protein